MEELCISLVGIDLKLWEVLLVDTEEVYSILNYYTLDAFRDRVCSFDILSDYFRRNS